MTQNNPHPKHLTLFGVPYLDCYAVALRRHQADAWLQQWAIWLQTGRMADWATFNLFYRTNPDLCDTLLVNLWGLWASTDFTAKLTGRLQGNYRRKQYMACFMWAAWHRRGLLLFVDVAKFLWQVLGKNIVK